MQRPLRRARLRTLALLLLLPLALASALAPALLLSGPQPAFAQTDPIQFELRTLYWTIVYPDGEEEAARWYASFADDVNEAVAEMLGQPPVEGLTLRIFSTEAAYTAANPAAEAHTGIMAHAIPEKLEVGVAVERLRLTDPALARESFRHEMTHIIAAKLSDQRLPIAFQEGLAQYNELSTSRAQESMQVLRNVQASGGTLPSWVMLNDRAVFMQNPDLSYPQSYSIMAYLAEKYGMGTFAKFMEAMRGGSEWPAALRSAYGTSVYRLERDWRTNYLPSFLKDQWQENVLMAYDLSAGVALYEAGHFSEAVEQFTASQKLYSDLGRTEKADAAAAYLEKGRNALDAAALASQARLSLETYDYKEAADGATRAMDTFRSLALPAQVEAANDTLTLAQKGVSALALLEEARGHATRFDLPGARSAAGQAGEVFASLGDTARASEAKKLVDDLSSLLVWAGVGTLGLGLVSVGGAAVAGLRSRRRKARGSPATQLGEESGSWL